MLLQCVFVELESCKTKREPANVLQRLDRTETTSVRSNRSATVFIHKEQDMMNKTLLAAALVVVGGASLFAGDIFRFRGFVFQLVCHLSVILSLECLFLTVLMIQRLLKMKLKKTVKNSRPPYRSREIYFVRGYFTGFLPARELPSPAQIHFPGLQRPFPALQRLPAAGYPPEPLPLPFRPCRRRPRCCLPPAA